jgi:two-component system nitrate/nitrite response regulator NarL
MRIAIVDPAPALRAGLRLLLTEGEGQTPETAIDEAASLDDLAAASTAVDVLVITSQAVSKLALERWLSAESSGASEGIRAAVLMLLGLPVLGKLAAQADSDIAQCVWVLRQAHLRAWGLLPLDASAEELQAAVQALDEGLVVLPYALFDLALAPPGGAEFNGGTDYTAQSQSPGATRAETGLQQEPLTERENQVLQLLARGLGNKQIAAALGISEHTAKFHVSAIYSKLGAINRAEAVRAGIQHGLISL